MGIPFSGSLRRKFPRAKRKRNQQLFNLTPGSEFLSFVGYLNLSFDSSIFVGIEFFLLKRGALKVFETKQNIIDLIIYTLTIIGTQLTFFVCIQYANAPFAAVLTATVPLWIMLFMFVFQHKHLTVKEIFCGIVAVAGVVLVVTGGSFKNFNVSGIGFWAGIGSGITFQLLLKGCTIEAPKPTD